MSTQPRTAVRKSQPAAPIEITSEAEAIASAQQGSPEAFGTLYRMHRRKVYALCLRMTRNVAEAEDLTHEVFLRLFRKIGTFRGDSAFSSWLYRLSVNIVLMHLRRESRRELPLEDMTDPNNEDNNMRREFGGPDPLLNGSLDRVSLERALKGLSPGYGTAIVLHFIEGYRHREIANITGCTVGASKSQVHKARLKLQGLLRAPNGRAA